MMIHLVMADQTEMPQPTLCLKLSMAMLLMRHPSWALPMGVSREDLNTTEAKFFKYKVFFCLRLAFDDYVGSLFTPTKDVDRLWHNHLFLDTLKYMMLCDALGGKAGCFLHHHRASQELQELVALARTCKNYKAALQAIQRKLHRFPQLAVPVLPFAELFPVLPLLPAPPLPLLADANENANDDDEAAMCG